MIAYEVPLLIIKIIANITLFLTIFLTWKFKVTPSFCAPLFFLFNIAGLFFLSLGLMEDIDKLIISAAFIIFVSYILIICYLTDKYFQRVKKEKE